MTSPPGVEDGRPTLRDVEERDLPIFLEQQLDPEATRMAAFPARPPAAFMAHWAKLLLDRTVDVQTVVVDGQVAGNVVCWGPPGERLVGTWLGRDFWGRGIAGAALAQFLRRVTTRPLFARVAKTNVASLRVLEKCGFVLAGEDRFATADGSGGEEHILTLG